MNTSEDQNTTHTYTDNGLGGTVQASLQITDSILLSVSLNTLLNGLRHSAWHQQPLSIRDIIDTDNIKVYTSGDRLFFEGKAISEYSDIQIYSINGKLLDSASVLPENALVEFNCGFWNMGVYLYQLIGEGKASGGTFVLCK